MFVCSVDTATKSLAISIIYYNTNLTNDINTIYNNYLVDKKLNPDNAAQKYLNLLTSVNKLLDNKMQIYYLNVVDLIPGKKVSEVAAVFRTKALHYYLNTILDPIIDNLMVNNQGKDWLFLMEYQLNANQKSNLISSQIMYHFTKYTIVNTKTYSSEIQLVGPSLKNKIIIGDEKGNYSNFIEKNQTNYAANKSHTRFNFLRLIKQLGKEPMIKDIKKKNIDDIADSVLQGLAYVIKYKGF